MIDRREILDFLNKRVGCPMTFRNLAEQLGLSSSERRALKKILRALTAEGLVTRTNRGLYGPVQELQFMTGYFEAHREGYGFVILQEPMQRDIFIPSRATMGAMDNDKVIVRVENRKKREGSIVKILQRAHLKVSGIFDRNRSGYFVRPKDPSIKFDIYIPPEEANKAEEGDMVVAEIINYPQGRGHASGRIKRILKRPSCPSEHIDNLIEELDVPSVFPHKVLVHAHDCGLLVNSKDRQDLRGLKTVTIDGEKARDFDDAISIGASSNGYTLWVHIADVSHYVGWNSPMDLEARRRGNSFYFPDRVIPMLPQALSEDLCSLKPKEDRLTFTVEMEFDRQGNLLGKQFYRSLINSNERLTYNTVRDIIAFPEIESLRAYEYLKGDIQLMYELSLLLRSVRKGRGSLDFDLPEPEVLLDMQGNPEDIIRAERNLAHNIIEEFMIAANEAVAREIEDSGMPSIYRVHELPERDKLEETFRFLHDSGLVKDPFYIKARDLHQFIRHVNGHPLEDLITKHLLRSLKQARYSTDNIGHYGLASQTYTHFTSPIRRYPDLIVHRILKTLLFKEPCPEQDEALEEMLNDIAFLSSRMERKANDCERGALEVMRCWLMKGREGECFDAKVINVTPYGLRVRLKEFYVEGFINVSYMVDDFYRYDERSYRLIGLRRGKSFYIGSEVRVRLENVDIEGRELLFGFF